MFHFKHFGLHCSLSTSIPTQLKKYATRVAAFLGTLLLAACGTWIPDNFPDGELQGVATVEWASEAKRWCIPIARTGLVIKRSEELLLL